MQTDMPLSSSVEYEAIKVIQGSAVSTKVLVATEIPFTIQANETELVTLMCTPANLKELCYGYLFTSGIIAGADEILSYDCDEAKWVAHVKVKGMPDPSVLRERLHTSGRGKDIMHGSVSDISTRRALVSSFVIDKDALLRLMRRLQRSSSLFKKSGGVHTAALSERKEMPKITIDDIGRHNAVDKIIGDALIRGVDFSECVLASSGRTSLDILHKAKRCGIPISVSRGAPTYQTILRAREMGMTVVGFARGGAFTIYTHPERIRL